MSKVDAKGLKNELVASAHKIFLASQRLIELLPDCDEKGLCMIDNYSQDLSSNAFAADKASSFIADKINERLKAQNDAKRNTA